MSKIELKLLELILRLDLRVVAVYLSQNEGTCYPKASENGAGSTSN